MCKRVLARERMKVNRIAPAYYVALGSVFGRIETSDRDRFSSGIRYLNIRYAIAEPRHTCELRQERKIAAFFVPVSKRARNLSPRQRFSRDPNVSFGFLRRRS